jgi:flagellar hook-length control protein FliK
MEAPSTPVPAHDDRQRPAEAPPAVREVRPPPETIGRTELEPAPAMGGAALAPVPEPRPAAAAKPAAAQPVEPPLPVEQVPMRIAKAAAQHEHRITIRLDPPDLGRVDIVLDTRRDLVHVAMAVERADTLELLRRDAPLLDQALARASLRLDGNLEFSLQQGLQQRPGGQPGDGRHQPYAAYPERGRDAAEPGVSVGPASPARLSSNSIDIIV